MLLPIHGEKTHVNYTKNKNAGWAGNRAPDRFNQPKTLFCIFCATTVVDAIFRGEKINSNIVFVKKHEKKQNKKEGRTCDNPKTTKIHLDCFAMIQKSFV